MVLNQGNEYLHDNSVLFVPEMITVIQLIYSGVKKHDSKILSCMSDTVI